MLFPLLCGIVYLLLSMPVFGNLTLACRGAHAEMKLSLHAWWLSVERPLRRGEGKKRAGLNEKRMSIRILRAALRAARWGKTEVTVRMGTGDAAQTAVLAGGVRALAETLGIAVSRRFPLRVCVKPEFSQTCFVLNARCIFSFVPGDIIFAVLLAAVRKEARGGFLWKSIRLRV